MGGCVSLDKSPESAGKLQLSIESKNEKLLILSPVKEKPDTVAGERLTIPAVAVSPFHDSGIKEETFFDSQPWLESDCEDDFYSVKGDFTPSLGSTPVHHNFLAGTPRVNRELVTDSTTPPERRKKLSELFRESFRGDQNTSKQIAASNENEVVAKVVEPSSKSAKWTIYIPRVNSRYGREKFTSGAFGAEDKSVPSMHRCLPRLLSIRSSTEAKKRMNHMT